MTPAYDVLAPFHIRAERDVALAALRRDDPVHWDPRNGWWLVTRHADVRDVSRTPELFSSEPRGPWHAFESHFSMQAMDGEPHRRHRSVVSRAFTPRMVASLGESALRYADEAIDALPVSRSAEFVSELAVPVPMRIIADMLGVADGDLDSFRRWTDAVVVVAGGQASADDLEEANRSLVEFHGYLGEMVERRRAEPGDDILSRIIEADEEGALAFGGDPARLEANEITDFALFLLVAGNETTRNGISQGMLALFEHPEARRRLAADATLWDTAAGEILRWTTPVRAMRRVAMRDTTLRGRKIEQGQSVVMVYASANQDEEVFDEPQTFRVDRTPNDFLTFGLGTHYCLGANLARLEIRAVLSRVLERVPGIRLATGTAPVESNSALLDGLEELPVEW